MNCKKCGYENSEGYKFCPICGEKFVATKLCAVCSSEVPENFVFCPECGNRCDGKKICANCQIELKPEHEFCPECGLKAGTKPVEEVKDVEEAPKVVEEQKVVETTQVVEAPIPVEKPQPVEAPIPVEKPQPVEEPKVVEVTKPKKEKRKIEFMPIFNLASKIMVATLCFIALLVFSFGVIHKAELKDGKTYDVHYTGFNLIDYSIKGIRNIEIDEMEEILEEKVEKMLEKYDEEDPEDLKSSEFKEFVKKTPFMYYALYDGEENYENPNTILVIQLVINALVYIGVVVLLILATVYSILAIFKKEYSYKKLVKLMVIPAGLILLFASALKLSPVSSYGYVLVSSTTLGKGALAAFILLLVSAALVYVFELLNKNVNFNLKKVISKSVGLVVVLISVFAINGVFSTVSYKNSDDDNIKISYDIQTTYYAFELGMTNAEFKRENGEYPYPTVDILDGQFDELTKKEAAYHGAAYLSYLFASDEVFKDSLAPELLFFSYIAYVVGSVFLALAFASILGSLYNNKHKVNGMGLIICSIIAFAGVIVLISLANGALVEEVKNLYDDGDVYFKMKSAINAGPIVWLVLLLGVSVSTAVLKGIDHSPVEE